VGVDVELSQCSGAQKNGPQNTPRLPAPTPPSTHTHKHTRNPNPRSKAHPGSQCPDAEGARLQLASERARVLEVCALIAISGDSSAFSGVLLRSMDDDESPRRPAPRSPEWMLWLTEQLRLDAEQVGLGVCGGGVRVALGRVVERAMGGDSAVARSAANEAHSLLSVCAPNPAAP